jgi:phage baseplate assembly protein W
MASNTQQKQEIYSDIFMNLNVNPGNNQLARHINENAVKRSIRNLILTNVGERFFSNIGCKIRSFLFEQISPVTAEGIKSAVTETIETHERRVTLIDVIVTPDYQQDLYTVTIVFGLINIQDSIKMEVRLNRIR